MIKKAFWKAFYKINLGRNYSSSCKFAASICSSIEENTKGNLSSFYNINGEQIRGWHRPSPGLRKKKSSNDSMDKYINAYR